MLLGLGQSVCPDVAAGGREAEMGVGAHHILYFLARKDGFTQLTISAMAENWRKVFPFSAKFNTELSLNGGT